jgi:TonB-dependent SusC/RagA subfamily outer membrane receptor
MPFRSVTLLARGATLAAAAVLLGSAIAPAGAQDLAQVDRGPRFLREVARGRPRVTMDLNSTPVLYRRISLDGHHRTLGELLTAIAVQSRLELIYSADLLPLDRPMRFRADSITVAAALTEVLVGANVDVVFYSLRQAGLVKRGDSPIGPSGTVVGRVTDAKTGEGVRSAEILLNDGRWRATSDSAGRYRLAEVDTGTYPLAVRRFGYTKFSRRVTVRAEHTDTIDVALAPVVTRLNELVTTATGQRRRVDIANDVTTINADSVMRTAPIRSVTDLLEGRVPGLTVQHTSGAPGDPSRLRLRGASSPLRSNDPIVIVDGVRFYAEQSAARSANLAGLGDTTRVATSAYATPSPLDYIDPNSIATIEVLKGPSAATLYGQDAANGVIVITTKKGQAGPTRWTASAEQGRTRIEGDYPELYLRWGHLLVNNTRAPCSIQGRNPVAVAGQDPQLCQGDSLVTFQILNDPALTVLDQGHRTALTLGASGGNQAFTYAVTGSYGDELGLPKLPDYEVAQYQARTSASPPDWMRRPQHLQRWGVTSQVTARLGTTADLSLNTIFSRTQQQRSALEQQLGTLMSTYLDRATGTYYSNNVNGFSGTFISQTNQILENYFERATAAATQFTPGLNVSWRPRGWLTLTSDAGLNVIQRADEILLPRGAPTRGAGGQLNSDSVGHLNTGQGTTITSTVNLRGNALAPLGRGFLFQVAAGANYTGTSFNDLAAQTQNLAPGTSTRGAVINGLAVNGGDNATFGWYLEPSVGNSKFHLSSGFRIDGGGGRSRATLPNPLQLLTNPARFFQQAFPKLGFSYLVSDEPWFPFKDQVQSLRARIAYGKASRQPGLTDRLRLYNALQQVYENGQYVPAVFLQTLGNTQVRPERSTELEGGFDADLLASRITLSVTGYRKTTDDALLSVPVAASVYGDGTSIIKNIGKIRNTGLEVTVAAQLVRSGPLTWGTQLSVSQNRNVVVALGPGVDPFYTASGIRVAAGYPLFGRWTPPVLGYADANGDGILDLNTEILLGDTAVYVGQTLPNYTANLHTTVSLWRGAVAVSAGFLYEDGLSQENLVAEQLAPFSRGQNDPTASLAEQLATATLPSPGGHAYNWLQTVNTLRFNDLAVSYTVPTAVARRLGAQRLSVAVQGGNLGIWTNYRGLDPNVNAFSTGNSVTDTGVLPQPRTWQVRVNANY